MLLQHPKKSPYLSSGGSQMWFTPLIRRSEGITEEFSVALAAYLFCCCSPKLLMNFPRLFSENNELWLCFIHSASKTCMEQTIHIWVDDMEWRFKDLTVIRLHTGMMNQRKQQVAFELYFINSHSLILLLQSFCPFSSVTKTTVLQMKLQCIEKKFFW